MLKNITLSVIAIILSFVLVYFLADKFILPQFLYTEEVKIPKLIGHNISSAKAILEMNDLDYKIQYVPSTDQDSIGTVIYTNPRFQKNVKKHTVIDLKVMGLQESYTVPDLKFKSKSVALNMLKSMGLTIDTIIYDYWDVICTYPTEVDFDYNFNQIIDNCSKYDKNIVWNQIPSPNHIFYKNDSITLFVSKGSFAPELYDVPILIDLSLEDAIELINDSGLILGNIEFTDVDSKKNIVIDQSQYGKCRINSKINLTVQK